MYVSFLSYLNDPFHFSTNIASEEEKPLNPSALSGHEFMLL